MAIELPSNPDVLAERLALLEDPVLAERLARENPSLFTAEPPQTEREVLAWTTRRFGTALIAVTAAIAVAAGYLGNELRRTATAPPAPATRAAAAVAPAASHRSAAAPHRAAAAHHAATPARHAPAPVAHRTIVQPVVTHSVAIPHPAIVAHPAVVTHPAVMTHHSTAAHAVAAPVPQPVRRHANAPSVVHHTGPATATRTAPATAADQLAAWEATHPASRTRPRSEPASSTEPATSTSTTTAAAPSTGPGSYPAPATPGDTTAPTGTRQPPSNPNGGWTERIPGGILGGVVGPILGVPRDSCTPRGGRTGIVMEAVQAIAAGRH